MVMQSVNVNNTKCPTDVLVNSKINCNIKATLIIQLEAFFSFLKQFFNYDILLIRNIRLKITETHYIKLDCLALVSTKQLFVNWNVPSFLGCGTFVNVRRWEDWSASVGLHSQRVDCLRIRPKVSFPSYHILRICKVYSYAPILNVISYFFF